MKYVLVLADGMADWPIPALDGKTPMAVARKPWMNRMAKAGKTGICQTVPEQFAPGSDVANLSVLGYPPAQFYKGRSSLEAISAGVPMGKQDVSLRANLVTLSDEEKFEDKRLLDYCGGEITTANAHKIIKDLQEQLNTEMLELYPSVSFRNILLWKQGPTDLHFTPAHEITGKPVAAYLPKGDRAEVALSYMRRAHEILQKHPYNVERIAKGEATANGIWLWGLGTKPILPPFQERYGLKGGIMSGVDLIRGIGMAAKMDILRLHSATGGVVTDFLGKGQMAAAYLKGGGDFVFVHVEAPDESGHQNKRDMKIKAIEAIDGLTIPAILGALKEMGEEYRMLIMPDHATPLEIRTHSREAVPFVLFDSRHHTLDGEVIHDEARAREQGLSFPDGASLLKAFFNIDFY